jgi:hypothetical protein
MVIVSEFGFSPHWERIEGPHIIDPAQYYYIPEDVSADSLEADIQRQRVIKDQMGVFRAQPFVNAATFWNYRGNMGVVDEYGRPRPSWRILQEEFTPLVIEKVDFIFPKKDQCTANIVLRTRGPIENDLPAYTLRNYRVAWEFQSSPGRPIDLRGEVYLPVLPPGTLHNLSIEFPRAKKRSKLHVAVLRPTGFTVVEQLFDLSYSRRYESGH